MGKTIWAMGLAACMLLVNACSDKEDIGEPLWRPTALVTVYPDSLGAFTMQLDDSTTLVPTNMKTSPFGQKIVRALVNYTQGDMPDEVHVNWVDSIRTKAPVMTQGEEDEKLFGNDPIEIVRDWCTVAEDGFITLRIRTLWGGKATHVINLVSGVNGENIYEFDLRHNAQGDICGKMGDALIAFNLNSLWEEGPEEVKIKLNWLSFSGEKSAEFSLKMHSE